MHHSYLSFLLHSGDSHDSMPSLTQTVTTYSTD